MFFRGRFPKNSKNKEQQKKKDYFYQKHKKEIPFQSVGKKKYPKIGKTKESDFLKNHYSTEQQQQQKSIAIVVCGKCGVV